MNELKECGITEQFIRKEHKKQPPRIENTDVIYVELVLDLKQLSTRRIRTAKSKYSMKDILGEFDKKQPINEQNIIKLNYK